MMTPSDLVTALGYAARGWLVIPLHSPAAHGCSCGRADCESPGKHPRTAHGLKDASRDPATIREWWTRWPDANIGIVTGAESGILVLDVDGKQGEQSLIELERRYGPLPDSYTVRTGGGGQHLYFLWPKGADVRNSQSRIAPGLDIRGNGGYVVAPPSVHASGARYEINESAIPPVLCPGWLLSLIQEPQGAQTPQSTSVVGALVNQPIGKGGRTKHLVSLAGSMHKRGMTPAAIEAALLVENGVFSPPLPDAKVRAIARDIPARYPNPKGITECDRMEASQSGNPGGYELIHLGELMARPDAPVDYLVEGLLIAGTVAAVVAKPKVGKSTFARNLALAVSTGRDFLGRKTRQGEVIYLALEERAEDVKADFRALGASGEEPIRIHAAHAPEDAMPALVRLVRERTPALVVIDPLFRLARIRDEKAYAETYQALGPLIDIARETGTHILLTHHAGKSLKADAIDSPLGSTALGGIVSTLLLLKRTETYRTLQTVQRICTDLSETVLAFDPVTRKLSLDGSKAERDQSDAESRILTYLQTAGKPQAQKQIRDEVEGTTKTIRAALTSLTRSERVKRTGEGTRGKPYLYEKWFSGSQDIQRTREPETQNSPETRANGGGKLVRENEEQMILDRSNLNADASPFDSACGGLLQ